MTTAYVKHARLNLFRRSDFSGIAYSDGDEPEYRILEAIRLADNRSVFSADLARAVTDWPSEYHLSRERHCLLRPLPIMPGDSVLELGCGCGAITRYLGELGAVVTGVEGSPRRAEIAAERCIDLPNVRIFAEDLFALRSEEKFDWVLLVGVLEYAPVFSEEAEPALGCIRSAAQFLAPKGRLVLAIENKLGIKYFKGSGEDHVNIPFYGIQGLYGPSEPRTYGYMELKDILRCAGLSQQEFWFPFPDYKLPRVIFSEEGVRNPCFNAADLLSMVHARDYGGRGCFLFDEALAFREAARNGILNSLSNSFLIVAETESKRKSHNLLAASYAVQRRQEFATETIFSLFDNKIKVDKRPLFGGAHERLLSNGSVLRHIPEGSEYKFGQLLLWQLTEARARRSSTEHIVKSLSPWFDFLLENSSTKVDSKFGRLAELTIDGRYLELTPFNIIETQSGLFPIDLEWQINGPIPLGLVVVRGLLHSLSRPGLEQDDIFISDVLSGLCARAKLEFDDENIREWLKLEIDFQRVVSDRPIKELYFLPKTNSVSVNDPSSVQQQNIKNQSVHKEELVAEREAKLGLREAQLADREIVIAEKERSAAAKSLELSEREEKVFERENYIARSYVEIEKRESNVKQQESAQLKQKNNDIETLSHTLTYATQTIAYISSRYSLLSAAIRKRGLVKRARKSAGAYAVDANEIDILRRSVFYDEGFYLSRYPDVRNAGDDPAVHYLQYGGLEGRDPGPAFSTRQYLLRNPDVAAAKVNALLHYELHGRQEGREPGYNIQVASFEVKVTEERRAMPWRKRLGMFLAKPTNQRPESDIFDNVVELPLSYSFGDFYPIPRVAVLLHAHYIDQLSEFRRALSNIPFPFALFISTDSVEKQKIIEQSFSGWQLGSLEIRVFPNIGRDIAPKFVGFRDVHEDYDFVLHIHTKKSPHSDHLEAWRSFLIDCLIGSPEIVKSIFEMFKECPKLGIIAPRNFPLIRKFMVWGVNFQKCSDLAKKMGVDLHENSPLDFAAGSMFWARSAALKPLLDLDLKFDDFPKERGQTDGEINHAIERLTFYSCELAGYTWCHAGSLRTPQPFEKFFKIKQRADLREIEQKFDSLLPAAQANTQAIPSLQDVKADFIRSVPKN